jgi:hypothetical protein
MRDLYFVGFNDTTGDITPALGSSVDRTTVMVITKYVWTIECHACMHFIHVKEISTGKRLRTWKKTWSLLSYHLCFWVLNVWKYQLGDTAVTSMDIRRAAKIGKQQEAAVDTLNTRGPCRAFVSGARRACRQPLSTLALVREIIWSLGNQDPFPGRLQRIQIRNQSGNTLHFRAQRI